MTEQSLQQNVESSTTKPFVDESPESEDFVHVEAEKDNDYSSHSTGKRLTSSSSALSEGICLSLLGTPCTRAKPKTLNPIEEKSDNIGSIFGKKTSETEAPKSSVQNTTKNSIENPPTIRRNSQNNTEGTRRTSLDLPTRDKTSVDKTQKRETNTNTNQNSQQKENNNNSFSQNLSESRNTTLNSTTIPTEESPLTYNENTITERPKANSKEFSQQTVNPSILKQTYQPDSNSNNMQQDFTSFRPITTSSPANSSRRMNCRGRGDPCVEADKDNTYRVPAERQKIVLTSDKILQTSENNLLRAPCSCNTDTIDYSSSIPQRDSLETPYESTYGTTQETSSTMCYCCKCRSPLPSKPEHYCTKNICRYRSKRSVISARSSSPPPSSSRRVQREKASSPCECRHEPCSDSRRPVRPAPRRKPITRPKPQREDCSCEVESR